MNNSLDVVFGFLGGTILSVDGGYKVLPQPPSERVFTRLADAKWFLALRWCEQFDTPAGVLTNTEQFSFHNEPALCLGEEGFIPKVYRPAIFKRCLSLAPMETARYSIPVAHSTACRVMEIQGIEIDPRYGKVALVREYRAERSFVAIAV